MWSERLQYKATVVHTEMVCTSLVLAKHNVMLQLISIDCFKAMILKITAYDSK